MKAKLGALSYSVRNERFLPVAILLAAVFVCGAVVGSTCAASLSAEAGTKLANTLFSYFAAADEGALNYTFSNALIQCLAAPLVIWLLGFALFGVIAIPVVVSFKGFMLGYTLAVLLRLFGARGALFALAFFSAEFFIVLPCMMVMAVFALFFSISIFLRMRDGGKESSKMPVKAYFTIAGISLVLLTGAAVAEYFILPGLFAALSA